MAEGAGSAVDVQLLVRDVQFPGGQHGNHGEGLVDLEQVHLTGGPASPIQGPAHGRPGCGCELRRFLGMGGVTDDPRDGVKAQPFRHRGPGQDEGRRAIRDRAGVGRRDRAVLREGRLQGRDTGGIGPAGLLVPVDPLGPLPAGDLHGHHLAVKGTGGLGGKGALQGADGEGVHGLTANLVGPGRLLGEGPHQPARLIGILQPVQVHGVRYDVVADARATPVLGQQVGGVGHALHAASDDDIGAARREGVVGEDGRLHARAAHLVHRCRLAGLRKAGTEGGLAGRRLAETSGQDAAHVDLLHAPRVDASPLHGGADGGGT